MIKPRVEWLPTCACANANRIMKTRVRIVTRDLSSSDSFIEYIYIYIHTVGFFCDILSLNVKMYLWLKLYTVPFFVSGQTYKISKGSNNYYWIYNFAIVTCVYMCVGACLVVGLLLVGSLSYCRTWKQLKIWILNVSYHYYYLFFHVLAWYLISAILGKALHLVSWLCIFLCACSDLVTSLCIIIRLYNTNELTYTLYTLSFIHTYTHIPHLQGDTLSLTHTHTHTHKDMHIHTHVCTQTGAHLCTRTHAHANTHVDTRAHTITNRQIHTRTHTHTCIHT